MIKLEHLNLVVRDMVDTLRFYQAAFPHWRIRSKGEGDWYGTYRHWLHFGDDYQYLTFNDNGQGENRNLASHDMGLAHFAFVVDNLDAVVTRLATAGFERDKGGYQAEYRKNCYFIDPSGYEVEFVEYASDIPAQRNLDD
ncbi:VOC family protein [Paraferrimonas sedimenticola]|uniref:Glyoxalase n=1 Tax=Paraferrimonas sedimenticola TaxID=375674 RepID=A0AA37W1H7_9GAMM|nr:VOC family protein [Paraferrimonas sedimenticola]GLP96237.1 glyoxalase [Paraferrimonas sedimenticola]